MAMRLDHLSFAAGHGGLDGTVQRISALLGEPFSDGGVHPRFGTRNRVLPLREGTYLEVVEVLDHPASDKAPFGQAVRARSETGGGWLGWCVATDELQTVEQRLGRAAVKGNRHLPDGDLLEWQQIGVRGMQSDPQLPFFVHWLSGQASHPSVGGKDVELLRLEIAGDRERMDDWLGGQTDRVLNDVEVQWIAPNGQPGLVAALFSTPLGKVRI